MRRDRTLVAVVNDDVAFIRLFDTVLRAEEGVDTLLLQIGNPAYESIKQAQPDLIVLDISIEQPDMSWHIVDLLMLDPATSRIPVLICSARDALLHTRMEKLLSFGYALIEKPIALNDLLVQVHHILIRRNAENNSSTS